jgi:hypothetical protein
MLLASEKASIAHYVGRFGWVSLRVRNAEELALALDLIDESYEHNVPKRAREAAAKAAENGAPEKQATAKRGTKKTAAAATAKRAAKKRVTRG